MFLIQNIRTFNGAHSASYLMGTGNSFPGVKQSGRKVHRLPPSSAGGKEWNSAVPVCPPDKHRDSTNYLHHCLAAVKVKT